MLEETFIISHICEKIKKLRHERSLSQKDLANLLHINQNTYSDLEAGKRKIDIVRLVALAEIFGIPAAYFMEDYQSSKKKKKIRKKK